MLSLASAASLGGRQIAVAVAAEVFRVQVLVAAERLAKGLVRQQRGADVLDAGRLAKLRW